MVDLVATVHDGTNGKASASSTRTRTVMSPVLFAEDEAFLNERPGHREYA